MLTHKGDFLLNSIALTIRKEERRYLELRSVWSCGKDSLVTRLPELASTAKALEVTDHEVKFQYLGAKWYVRFAHDLSVGKVEYGLLRSDTDRVETVRIPLLVVSFDRLGNARVFEADSWSLMDNESAWLHIHEVFLAETAPKALREQGFSDGAAGVKGSSSPI